MRAVQFDGYGDVDVLQVRDVPTPTAAEGRVVVQVRAAGMNPGEIAIRTGALEARWPTTFPCGQGSDFAGVVTEVGAGVDGYAVGDEVVGHSDERASHAEYVSVPAANLVPKPPSVPWEQAGGTWVAGGAAWGGVAGVDAKAGETVVVTAAAGGVGSVAVQLLHARGAKVIALASADNQEFLESLHATFVDYAPREGLADRIREAAGEDGVAALVDNFGGGYVDLALDELGLPPTRVNTVIDFEAVEKRGVQGLGTQYAGEHSALAELVAMQADGRLRIPVAAAYPLEQVREAQTELADRHTRGKIVLLP